MSGAPSLDPTVSIVLCGYNQATFLDHAVTSALSQTYRNLELVILDNGSTDGSQQLAQAYAKDPRVRLVLHADNAAITKRLNDAVAASSGEFISILYADDYYLPTKIERQVSAFATLAPDYGVVYSPGYRVNDATGQRWLDKTLTVSGSILKEMFDRRDEGFINPISPLVRRQCFLDYPFHEDLFVEGENIFWRIAMKYKFHYLNEPLSVMREHAGNRGKAIKMNAKMVLTVYGRLEREPDFPRELLHDLDTMRGDFMGSCAWLGIRLAGDPKWARSCVGPALRCQPRQILRPRMMAALVLCMLPAGAVRLFNAALNRTKSRRETVAFREDYS